MSGALASPLDEEFTLSVREREVVAAVVSGQTNDEIGGRLGISRKGIEAHLSRLYERGRRRKSNGAGRPRRA